MKQIQPRINNEAKRQHYLLKPFQNVFLKEEKPTPFQGSFIWVTCKQKQNAILNVRLKLLKETEMKSKSFCSLI